MNKAKVLLVALASVAIEFSSQSKMTKRKFNVNVEMSSASDVRRIFILQFLVTWFRNGSKISGRTKPM